MCVRVTSACVSAYKDVSVAAALKRTLSAGRVSAGEGRQEAEQRSGGDA